MHPTNGRGLQHLRALSCSSALAVAAATGVAGSATGTAYPRAAADSSATLRALPFPPITEPGQSFAASDLTRRYTKNVMPFLRPDLAPPTDLAQLDRAAERSEARAAEADSSDVQLVDEQRRRAGPLTPEEKNQLVPPKPGAYVGIPGPVAATGALLGGLALLIKLIAELAR